MSCNGLLLMLGTLAAVASSKTIVVEFGPTEQYPSVLRLAPGDCVEWRNTGKSVHVVQATDGEFDSGYLRPSESFKRCFPTIGLTQYQDGVHPQQKSLVVVGDVDFIEPQRIVPTAKPPATPAAKFTPLPATQAPAAPAGVSIVASDVMASALSSNADAFVTASFGGSPGRVSAYATISDGCNTVRSAAVSVRAGDVDVQFGPMNVGSLYDGSVKIAVVVGDEPYAGADATKSSVDAPASVPKLDTQTLLWSSFQ